VEFADSSDPVCPVYHVLFIDFGNREKVKATSVRPIDPAISAVPSQAYPATLAYLKVPSLPTPNPGLRTLRGFFSQFTTRPKWLGVSLISERLRV